MNINPQLLQRLTRPLNQPGIADSRMATRLIEKYNRLVNRLPLLDQQMSRWSAIANLETEQVPIVYTQAFLEDEAPAMASRESETVSQVSLPPLPNPESETPLTHLSPPDLSVINHQESISVSNRVTSTTQKNQSDRDLTNFLSEKTLIPESSNLSSLPSPSTPDKLPLTSQPSPTVKTSQPTTFPSVTLPFQALPVSIENWIQTKLATGTTERENESPVTTIPNLEMPLVQTFPNPSPSNLEVKTTPHTLDNKPVSTGLEKKAIASSPIQPENPSPVTAIPNLEMPFIPTFPNPSPSNLEVKTTPHTLDNKPVSTGLEKKAIASSPIQSENPSPVTTIPNLEMPLVQTFPNPVSSNLETETNPKTYDHQVVSTGLEKKAIASSPIQPETQSPVTTIPNLEMPLVQTFPNFSPSNPEVEITPKTSTANYFDNTVTSDNTVVSTGIEKKAIASSPIQPETQSPVTAISNLEMPLVQTFPNPASSNLETETTSNTLDNKPVSTGIEKKAIASSPIQPENPSPVTAIPNLEMPLVQTFPNPSPSNLEVETTSNTLDNKVVSTGLEKKAIASSLIQPETQSPVTTIPNLEMPLIQTFPNPASSNLETEILPKTSTTNYSNNAVTLDNKPVSTGLEKKAIASTPIQPKTQPQVTTIPNLEMPLVQTFPNLSPSNPEVEITPKTSTANYFNNTVTSDNTVVSTEIEKKAIASSPIQPKTQPPVTTIPNLEMPLVQTFPNPSPSNLEVETTSNTLDNKVVSTGLEKKAIASSPIQPKTQSPVTTIPNLEMPLVQTFPNPVSSNLEARTTPNTLDNKPVSTGIEKKAIASSPIQPKTQPPVTTIPNLEMPLVQTFPNPVSSNLEARTTPNTLDNKPVSTGIEKKAIASSPIQPKTQSPVTIIPNLEMPLVQTFPNPVSSNLEVETTPNTLDNKPVSTGIEKRAIASSPIQPKTQSPVTTIPNLEMPLVQTFPNPVSSNLEARTTPNTLDNKPVSTGIEKKAIASSPIQPKTQPPVTTIPNLEMPLVQTFPNPVSSNLEARTTPNTLDNKPVSTGIEKKAIASSPIQPKTQSPVTIIPNLEMPLVQTFPNPVSSNLEVETTPNTLDNKPVSTGIEKRAIASSPIQPETQPQVTTIPNLEMPLVQTFPNPVSSNVETETTSNTLDNKPVSTGIEKKAIASSPIQPETQPPVTTIPNLEMPLVQTFPNPVSSNVETETTSNTLDNKPVSTGIEKKAIASSPIQPENPSPVTTIPNLEMPLIQTFPNPVSSNVETETNPKTSDHQVVSTGLEEKAIASSPIQPETQPPVTTIPNLEMPLVQTFPNPASSNVETETNPKTSDHQLVSTAIEKKAIASSPIQPKTQPQVTTIPNLEMPLVQTFPNPASSNLEAQTTPHTLDNKAVSTGLEEKAIATLPIQPETQPPVTTIPNLEMPLVQTFPNLSPSNPEVEITPKTSTANYFNNTVTSDNKPVSTGIEKKAIASSPIQPENPSPVTAIPNLEMPLVQTFPNPSPSNLEVETTPHTLDNKVVSTGLEKRAIASSPIQPETPSPVTTIPNLEMPLIQTFPNPSPSNLEVETTSNTLDNKPVSTEIEKRAIASSPIQPETQSPVTTIPNLEMPLIQTFPNLSPSNLEAQITPNTSTENYSNNTVNLDNKPVLTGLEEKAIASSLIQPETQSPVTTIPNLEMPLVQTFPNPVSSNVETETNPKTYDHQVVSTGIEKKAIASSPIQPENLSPVTTIPNLEMPLIQTQPESQSQNVPLLKLTTQPTTEGIIQAKYDNTTSLNSVFTPVKTELTSPTPTQTPNSFESFVSDLPMVSQTSSSAANPPVSLQQQPLAPISPIQPQALMNARQDVNIVGDRVLVENPVKSTETAQTWGTENEPLNWVTPDTPNLPENRSPSPQKAYSQRETTATIARTTSTTSYPVVIPKKSANAVSAFSPRAQKPTVTSTHTPNSSTATISPIVFAQPAETLSSTLIEEATNTPTLPLTFPTTPEYPSPDAIAVTTPLTMDEGAIADIPQIPVNTTLPTIQIHSQPTPPTLEPLVLSHPMKPQAQGMALPQEIPASNPILTQSTIPEAHIFHPPPTRTNPDNASAFGQQVQSAITQTVAQNAPPDINLDTLVAKIERKVLRRLVVESERRGKHKWR